MQAESTESDEEEPNLLSFPYFGSADVDECVQLRLVPKDKPNSRLIQELTGVFVDAAILAQNAPLELALDTVPDHQGVLLRSVMDQKVEEIREKAAQAEPHAAKLKKQLQEDGPNANQDELATALDKINQLILELRQRGIVVMARAE